MNKLDKKNKDNRLILWEGFRKELPWILLWILLGIMSYGYYQDKKICDEVLYNPCAACYKLNQTLMDSSYLFDNNIQDSATEYSNIDINESIIPYEDKNPNDRSISSY